MQRKGGEEEEEEEEDQKEANYTQKPCPPIHSPAGVLSSSTLFKEPD